MKEDAKILEEVQALACDVSADIDAFRLYLAGEKLYHFAWHRFADVILEESKALFQSDDSAKKESRARMLYEALTAQLKLLHPFTPYVTEEIWSALPHTDRELLLISRWPL